MALAPVVQATHQPDHRQPFRQPQFPAHQGTGAGRVNGGDVHPVGHYSDFGGIHTTLPFHQKVMDSTVFQWGQFDTSFLDGPDGFRMTAAPGQNLAQVAAVAAAMVEHERGQQAVILGNPCDGDGVRVSPWKLTGRPSNVRVR